LLVGATDAATRYKAVILNPSGWWWASKAYDISAGKQAGCAGGSATGGAWHAFLWSGTAGSYVDLHPIGFYDSFASGVSGGRQVGAGRGIITQWNHHALLWNGTAESCVDLHPSGFLGSSVRAISGDEQVGVGELWGGVRHALLWRGTPESCVDLTPNGFEVAWANGVYDGQQVGMGLKLRWEGPNHALLWSGTAESCVDLHPSGFSSSWANDISEGQQVGYGWGTPSSHDKHALLWSGTPESCVDLHPIGFYESFANGVSGGQQVGVGRGIITQWNLHALLWNGTAESCVDLHAFLPSTYAQSIANGIDSSGNIVGNAYTGSHNEYSVAVMWVPLPDVVPPVVSTSPATDVTKSSARLNGVLADDGDEACQYRFRYQDEKSDYIYTSWIGSKTTGELFSQAISGLNPNTTYYFNAQARNSAGESEWGNEQSFVARTPKTPIASFIYRPRRPEADELIVFDAENSRDPDGIIEVFEWDFGDGTSKSETDPHAYKTYLKPGEYIVTLTVIDNDGLSDVATSVIKVEHAIGPRRKRFMITFDDGPRPESTPYILDQLQDIMNDEGYPVKAGFFLVGEDKSLAAPDDVWTCGVYGICPDPAVMYNHDIVQRIASEGHIIGIHTQHHPNLQELEPADAASEVLTCYDAILDAGVIPINVFRSPYLADPIPLPAALEDDWSVIGGELTDDQLPSVSEEDVINKCRTVIQESESPVILIFHDHRGLPDYRFDFYNIIVNELVNKDGFALVDFEY
jgi:peptidoglycan/xylan/chitin deacetylase (PgdA/CDA1 family)